MPPRPSRFDGGFDAGRSIPATVDDLVAAFEASSPDALILLTPVPITKDNLDNQRNAVQEERRIGLDNAAYGKTGEIQQELMYDNFAYKHDTIGSMADLDAASLADVKQWFRDRYGPNNAVLVVAGPRLVPLTPHAATQRAHLAEQLPGVRSASATSSGWAINAAPRPVSVPAAPPSCAPCGTGPPTSTPTPATWSAASPRRARGNWRIRA